MTTAKRRPPTQHNTLRAFVQVERITERLLEDAEELRQAKAELERCLRDADSTTSKAGSKDG